MVLLPPSCHTSLPVSLSSWSKAWIYTSNNTPSLGHAHAPCKEEHSIHGLEWSALIAVNPWRMWLGCANSQQHKLIILLRAEFLFLDTRRQEKSCNGKRALHGCTWPAAAAFNSLSRVPSAQMSTWCKRTPTVHHCVSQTNHVSKLVKSGNLGLVKFRKNQRAAVFLQIININAYYILLILATRVIQYPQRKKK